MGTKGWCVRFASKPLLEKTTASSSSHATTCFTRLASTLGWSAAFFVHCARGHQLQQKNFPATTTNSPFEGTLYLYIQPPFKLLGEKKERDTDSEINRYISRQTNRQTDRQKHQQLNR